MGDSSVGVHTAMPLPSLLLLSFFGFISSEFVIEHKEGRSFLKEVAHHDDLPEVGAGVLAQEEVDQEPAGNAVGSDYDGVTYPPHNWYLIETVPRAINKFRPQHLAFSIQK